MTYPLIWESNPYAYGAIEARVFKNKKSIGGISSINNIVKGYYLGKEVYCGSNELAAIECVNTEHDKLCNEYNGYYWLFLE